MLQSSLTFGGGILDWANAVGRRLQALSAAAEQQLSGAIAALLAETFGVDQRFVEVLDITINPDDGSCSIGFQITFQVVDDSGSSSGDSGDSSSSTAPPGWDAAVQQMEALRNESTGFVDSFRTSLEERSNVTVPQLSFDVGPTAIVQVIAQRVAGPWSECGPPGGRRLQDLEDLLRQRSATTPCILAGGQFRTQWCMDSISGQPIEESYCSQLSRLSDSQGCTYESLTGCPPEPGDEGQLEAEKGSLTGLVIALLSIMVACIIGVVLYRRRCQHSRPLSESPESNPAFKCETGTASGPRDDNPKPPQALTPATSAVPTDRGDRPSEGPRAPAAGVGDINLKFKGDFVAAV